MLDGQLENTGAVLSTKNKKGNMPIQSKHNTDIDPNDNITY